MSKQHQRQTAMTLSLAEFFLTKDTSHYLLRDWNEEAQRIIEANPDATKTDIIEGLAKMLHHYPQLLWDAMTVQISRLPRQEQTLFTEMALDLSYNIDYRLFAQMLWDYEEFTEEKAQELEARIARFRGGQT